jgi:predicted metal-dependent peptidase
MIAGPARPVPGLAGARLWAAARFPYLASGIFGTQVIVTPGSETVAVDEHWRLHADPDIAAGWSAAELGSVLVHHVCHLLRAHADRARALGLRPEDAGEWTRAADAEINDDLVPAGLELPGDPVLPQHLGAEPGGLAEQYFRPGAGTGPGWEIDCGSGADGCARPGDGPPGRPAQARPGPSWPGRPAQDGPGAAAGLPSWQADLLRRLVAADCLRYGQEAGTVPGGLMRWAQGILTPAVDWRTLLAAELRRAIADRAGAADYSYRRPSRRTAVAGDVVLPALRRPVPEVAVVCDTSASMTGDLLAVALTEVESLLKSLGRIRQVRVLACDTAVAPAQRVSSARQVELIGGGGTNIGAGIAAASALRPRPAITVVLTDGYTPWPGLRPKGMLVVVALLGDAAPDAPAWARTVRVPTGSAR